MKKSYFERLLSHFVKYRIIITIFILLFILFQTTNGEAQDPLWEKAVKIAGANSGWIPGLIIDQEKMYGDEGNLEESSEIHFSLSKGKKEEVVFTLLKAQRDGKDVTKKMQRKLEKEMNNNENEYEIIHPFKASEQQYVVYKRKDQQRSINGKNCSLYTFTYESDEGTWRGTTCLDEETGIPFQVEGELTSLPVEEENVRIVAVRATTDYMYTGGGDWYPIQTVVETHIEIDDKKMKFKGKIHSAYKFSEYWKYK